MAKVLEPSTPPALGVHLTLLTPPRRTIAVSLASIRPDASAHSMSAVAIYTLGMGRLVPLRRLHCRYTHELMNWQLMRGSLSAMGFVGCTRMGVMTESKMISREVVGSRYSFQ
jgi:hypothetical protein